MPDIKLVNRGAGSALYYVIAGSHEAGDILDSIDIGISLAFVSVSDWDGDLSPWKAKACFKGSPDFTGGADKYLTELTGMIPRFESDKSLAPDHRAICGYSLAGLFSIYALYKTNMFDMAMSASGSLWFDGFTDYMKSNVPLAENPLAYLSLGDMEKRTRNQRLRPVEDNTIEASKILNAKFELNPGNHFVDYGARVARGIAWLNDNIARWEF